MSAVKGVLRQAKLQSRQKKQASTTSNKKYNTITYIEAIKNSVTKKIIKQHKNQKDIQESKRGI